MSDQEINKPSVDSDFKVKKSFLSIDPNQYIKRKQLFVALGIVVTLLTAVFYVTGNKGEDVSESTQRLTPDGVSKDAVRVDFSAMSREANREDLWIHTGKRKIEELTKRQQELENELFEAKNANTSSQQSAQMIERVVEVRPDESVVSDVELIKAELEKLKAELAAKDKHESERVETQQVKPADGRVEVVSNRFYLPPQKNSSPDSLAGCVNDGTCVPSVQKVERPFKSVSYIENESDTDVDLNEGGSDKSVEDGYKVDDYTPSASFFKAVIIGGVDAPTGGQAQQNPHPVVLKVDDLTFLPNRYRFDMKECHVLAHAYGDLSSERAMMRLESISCVDGNERVYERRAYGHVFGEDGKAGVRGRLVSKQGQVLANALVAGVGAGIGSAFNQQATTYSTNALGSVATIDPDKIGMAGLGMGVSKALDRLSQYYIDLAEKMFPIIEVSSQRVVDVVLTQGIDWKIDDSVRQPNRINSATSRVGASVEQLANNPKVVDILLESGANKNVGAYR
jgi:conjugal transfer pilus assembly protein TraB